MTPRDDVAAETREWLARAAADSLACVVLIEAALAPEALFHAQQCAEKVLKAGLVWRQITFGKTHDLDELKHRCLALFPAAAVAMEGIENLSQYAWRFRYPGAPYEPDRDEARQASGAASILLRVMTTLLEAEISG